LNIVERDDEKQLWLILLFVNIKNIIIRLINNKK
jgi:hypothetical protein